MTPHSEKPELETPGQQKLGPRSPLVLAKLGHDMRDAYDTLIQAPVPEEMRQTLEHLPPLVPRLVETEQGETSEPGPVLGDDALL